LFKGESDLHSKLEYIELLTNSYLRSICIKDDIPHEFDAIWNAEQPKAFQQIVTVGNLLAKNPDFD